MFTIFFLIATANTIVVSFLMSVAAFGALLTTFFTSLAVIYVGAVSIAATAISTITFISILAIIFAAGKCLPLAPGYFLPQEFTGTMRSWEGCVSVSYSGFVQFSRICGLFMALLARRSKSIWNGICSSICCIWLPTTAVCARGEEAILTEQMIPSVAPSLPLY